MRKKKGKNSSNNNKNSNNKRSKRRSRRSSTTCSSDGGSDSRGHSGSELGMGATKGRRGEEGGEGEGEGRGKRKRKKSWRRFLRGYRYDYLRAGVAGVVFVAIMGAVVIPRLVDPTENAAGEPDYTDSSFSIPLIGGFAASFFLAFAILFLTCRGTRSLYARKARAKLAGEKHQVESDIPSFSTDSECASYSSASYFEEGDGRHPSTRNPYYYVPD